MQKKTKLILVFSMLALLIVGQVSFAAESDIDNPSMMNGMTNMMKMMDEQSMMNMMNTPEGQQMMQSCNKFMAAYNAKKDEGMKQ